MTSPLDRLVGISLAAEPPDEKEFAGLKNSGLLRLKDSSNLDDTLGVGPEVWRVLDKCHRLRNAGEYEGDFSVGDRILSDLIAACRVVASKLEELPPLP